MKCTRVPQFEKDMMALSSSPQALAKVQAAIAYLESVPRITPGGKIEQIKGSKGYYRYKLHDYRIGFFLDKEGVILLRVLHRKDIYNKFP